MHHSSMAKCIIPLWKLHLENALLPMENALLPMENALLPMENAPKIDQGVIKKCTKNVIKPECHKMYTSLTF